MLYQAAYANYDKLTGNYDFLFRSYDPALGQFFAVDPMAAVTSGYSPYHANYNNPVMYTDPMGLCPECGYGNFDPLQQGDPDGAEPTFYMNDGFFHGARWTEWNGSHHWANGIGNNDWSPRTGSATYRAQNNNSLGLVMTYINSEVGWVSAQEILDHDPTNQNPLWRELASESLRQAEAFSSSGSSNEGSLSGDIFAGGLAISGVLLADDVTGVGVIDDVAIPFVIVGSGLVAGSVWLYENWGNPFPGPWTTERPLNYIPTAPEGFDPKKPNQFPDRIVRWTFAGYLGYKLYKSLDKTIPQYNPPADNTRYVIPRPIIERNN